LIQTLLAESLQSSPTMPVATTTELTFNEFEELGAPLNQENPNEKKRKRDEEEAQLIAAQVSYLCAGYESNTCLL